MHISCFVQNISIQNKKRKMWHGRKYKIHSWFLIALVRWLTLDGILYNLITVCMCWLLYYIRSLSTRWSTLAINTYRPKIYTSSCFSIYYIFHSNHTSKKVHFNDDIIFRYLLFYCNLFLVLCGERFNI